MDLALAIWLFNPAAMYRLTDDGSAILEWRGPGPQPTQTQLNAAWAQAQTLLAAQAAHAALRQQHLAALQGAEAAATANSTQTSADVTALQTIVAALEADTPPTAAQLRQLLRFVLRTLIALAT